MPSRGTWVQLASGVMPPCPTSADSLSPATAGLFLLACQRATPVSRRRSGVEYEPILVAEVRGAGSDIFKAITDPVEGLDHIEFAVGRPEPLAQALDMAVDGAVIDIDLFVVRHIHQGVAALDHARTAGQRLQDQEFGNRQGDRLILPG